MKQLLAEKPTQKNPAQDPNRTPMSLSALWQLWKDNLKSWRQYREEHPDLFTLNLQAGVRHLAARCRLPTWLTLHPRNGRARDS